MQPKYSVTISRLAAKTLCMKQLSLLKNQLSTGMHATRYSRQLSLSAFCNDWVYYVCSAS